MSPRRSLLIIGCLLLVCGEARSAESEERQRLEGTWNFVSSSGGNQKNDSVPRMKMVFKGESISFVPEGAKRTMDGAYRVDPGNSPRTMDITLEQGGKKISTLVIYELDGDTLKLCHYLGAKASQERPKEFVADKQTVVGVLKREAK